MKHFLVTGCSTGIGEACALDLVARGHRVFAGVRRDADGVRLRERSRETDAPGERLIPVPLEVTSPAAIAAAVQEVQRRLRGFQSAGLDGLVNNAGILVPGPLELLSTDDLRRQFEVNVLGVHAVTRAFLPSLRPTRGRLVIVGSISGVVTPPFMGAYAASKHALEAIADAFRMELRPWRISVSLLQPDSVATPIWDKMVAGTGGDASREGRGSGNGSEGVNGSNGSNGSNASEGSEGSNGSNGGNGSNGSGSGNGSEGSKGVEGSGGSLTAESPVDRFGGATHLVGRPLTGIPPASGPPSVDLSVDPSVDPSIHPSVAQVYREQLEQIALAARWMGQTGMPLERVLKALRHALLSRWPRARYRIGFRTHMALWAYPRLANRLFDLFMLSAMGLGWRRPKTPTTVDFTPS